ncbi:MAG TPA: site-specific DNA-methyltransferase [Polyangiaceae bacterium]|nr:site-specific DNA-methyltransferase [Polyangiaceae bacterium]
MQTSLPMSNALEAHAGASSDESSPRRAATAESGPPIDPSTIRRARIEPGDAVALLRRLPDASVDVIVTDPAYESLEKHRAIGTTTRLKHSKSSSNDWFAIFPNARFPELFQEAYRVLKKNAHLYLYCDQETMFVAKPIAEEAGFKLWKPLVWDKAVIGMGYHYRSRYELVLFFEKGKRKLHDLGVPDVLVHPRVMRGYPSEKPAAISRVLIRQSTEPGALVVDPFAGSGSVGVAAAALGRRFLGGDVCKEACEVAAARIAETPEGAPDDRDVTRRKPAAPGAPPTGDEESE